MDKFKNKLLNLHQQHSIYINKINREYQMHFFRGNYMPIINYSLTSLDDNTFNYNRIINRNNLIINKMPDIVKETNKVCVEIAVLALAGCVPS